MVLFNQAHLSVRNLVATFIAVVAVLSLSTISNIYRLGFSRSFSDLRHEVSWGFSRWRHELSWSFSSNIYEDEPKPKDVIGIELGDTHSRVGFFKSDTLQIFADAQGRSWMPNCVAFVEGGEPLVGFAAQERGVADPTNTVCDINFMLGANFTDIAVQNAHPHLAYSVVDVNNKPMIQTQFTNTDNLLITPENITATILSSLKTTAESHVQRPVTQAFIAVPSSFTEAQRDLIRATASATGMVVNRIMSSTVATVSGYGMHLEEDEHPCKPKPYHGLIYHLEEQQSKIAVWHDYGQDITEVVDERLGGSAMEFGDEDANRVSEFEKGVRDILASALKKANLTKSEITETVFTGNSTQTARFQSVVDTYLGFQARSHSLPSGEPVSPDEAILRGVTIAASWWENRHSGGIMEYDWDILPLSLGIEDRDGRFVPIMKNNYIIPLRRNQSFVTATDGQDTVVVDVYEGARLVAGKNNHLGTLRLENLQPREIGEVEIEVVFEVDQCYALTVWVKEKESGREEMLDVELDYWDGRNTSALWMEATMMREEDEGVLVQRMSEGEHAVFGVLKKDVPDEEMKKGWRVWLSEG